MIIKIDNRETSLIPLIEHRVDIFMNAHTDGLDLHEGVDDGIGDDNKVSTKKLKSKKPMPIPGNANATNSGCLVPLHMFSEVEMTAPIPIPTPTPTFISIIPIFSEQNRIDALNIQNIERRIKNVKDFTWSNIMETEAINWSRNLAEYNDCGLKHSLDTARGQNLYAMYGSTKSNINNAINAWVDEKKLIDNPNVTFNEIGHYLSIISPKFTQVGCGIAINPIQNCLVATCNYI